MSPALTDQQVGEILSGLAGARLRKHHGLGNDFLVLIDLDDAFTVGPDTARALCDRHRGVGADGLIRVTAGAGRAPLSMTLLNADGSGAETSGNGLRCLGQAVVDAGVVPAGEFWVQTAAGLRRLTVGPTGPGGIAMVGAGMGPAALGPEREAPAGAIRARAVDMGNPHLVVMVEDPAAVDLQHAGPAEEARHPGGVNVEYASARAGGITIRTWERGAGETMACGSGSCAAAAAFRSWGLVGDLVRVDNPGGPLEVRFEGEEIFLTGPAARVGTVVVGE
ncbi:MAG TPA: diaminopimelate epimerase [Acidimicrobiales bacterium]|nr:diaminopimelate epimerase [Acidimicrobiales bacterium]